MARHRALPALVHPPLADRTPASAAAITISRRSGAAASSRTTRSSSSAGRRDVRPRCDAPQCNAFTQAPPDCSAPSATARRPRIYIHPRSSRRLARPPRDAPWVPTPPRHAPLTSLIIKYPLSQNVLTYIAPCTRRAPCVPFNLIGLNLDWRPCSAATTSSPICASHKSLLQIHRSAPVPRAAPPSGYCMRARYRLPL